MIELREASYRAGKSTLIDRASLRIEPREVVALIGPNGAGKSTLLRLISGELRPTSGQVLWGGSPVASLDPGDLARARSVVGQRTEVSFPIEAREIVRMGRMPHSDPPERADQIVDRSMRDVEASHLGPRLAPSLSGGELQRVQTARALAQVARVEGPSALLLDEPTAALDPRHQHLSLRVAAERASGGAAVVCVLHDVNLAARYATRIVALQRGQIVDEGSPRGVLTPARMADLFGVEAEVIQPPDSPFFHVIIAGPTTENAAPRATRPGDLHG